MKKAIVLKWFIDHETKTVLQDIKIIEAPEKDNLDFFYKHIECRSIDVVQFDGFDVFVDDEGLLESGNVVAEYYQDGELITALAGNLVITNGIDSIGRTVWFDEDDYDKMIPIIHKLESFRLKGITR